ncbi:hypothetical protein [Peribacillus frigoritolerans]|nr:hypothetical protein [Peribacillus frigoritolerans]
MAQNSGNENFREGFDMLSAGLFALTRAVKATILLSKNRMRFELKK